MSEAVVYFGYYLYIENKNGMIYLDNNNEVMRAFFASHEIAVIDDRLNLKDEKLTELQKKFIRHLISFNVDTKEEEKDLVKVLFTLLVQQNIL